MKPPSNRKTKLFTSDQKKRWPRVLTMAFIGICISLFGFAGAAQAADITLRNQGTGSGEVRYSDNGGASWTNQTLSAGQSVPITVLDGSNVDFDLVNADPNSSFAGWSGDGAAGTPPVDWTLSAVAGGEIVNATFELKKSFTLTIQKPWGPCVYRGYGG